MECGEANDRLAAIAEYCDRVLGSGSPMLVQTQITLEYIKAVATAAEENFHMGPPIGHVFDHIILSCDASIKKNPGGPASVGFVVQFPDERKPLQRGQGCNSTTNNQAEYDAIYFGLTTLMNLHHNPGCEIEVRSDSRICIQQLNGEIACNEPELQRRRDLIHELVAVLPVQVVFVWRPRNSTPELRQANYLAQDVLGVPRH
jgi:ribonuclease HI